jgi:hypothetical protein
MDDYSRREFVRLMTAGAAALLAHGCTPKSSSSADAGPGLPYLGGAPDTPEGRTIAAFVDSVIPGGARDSTGAPGGLDVNAPALFFDPALPGASYVPLLVQILDAEANSQKNDVFSALSFEDREAVLEEALASVPLLEFAFELARLAFFSAEKAFPHLGYPGANAGYVDDPDFSFKRPLITEITTDGNLP